MLHEDIPGILDGCMPLVLAGGRGSRMVGLTGDTCKPALPFGAGGQRLIDFSMASLHAAGFRRVMVATQYRPADLIRHLQTRWAEAFPDGLVLRDATRLARGGYRGTAHALLANLDLLEDLGVNDVLVMPADQICDVDLRTLVQRHRVSEAEATLLAATISTEAAAAAAGHRVVETARDGRVLSLVPTPGGPGDRNGKPRRALVPTGIHLFRTTWLRRVLPPLSQHRFDISIEADLLDLALREKGQFAHRLAADSYGREDYWRDVDTPDDYQSALRDFNAPDGWPFRRDPLPARPHLAARPAVAADATDR